MSQNQFVRWIVLLLIAFVTACSGPKSLTVTQVLQNADRLDGKTIRVRGQAYLWVDPSQAAMWMTGGCIPKTDPSYRQGVTTGWLTLYDSLQEDNLAEDGTPRDKPGIKISEENFRCNGDYCTMTCSPFEVTSLRTYEFVGTLRTNPNSELILEDIDLGQSSQLVDGKWTSISTRKFDVMFP
jgi:hypothetical protein